MQRLSIARSLRLALVGLTVALAVVAAVGVASLYTSRQHYEDKLVDSASLATAAANLASAGVTEEEVLRDARGPGAAAARSQAAATFAAAARNVMSLAQEDPVSMRLAQAQIAAETQARQLAAQGRFSVATAPSGPLAQARSLANQLQARQLARQATARADARSSSRRALLLVAIAGVLAIVGALALVAGLVRGMQAPLDDLVKATRGLVSGRLGPRVKPAGPRELQELARAFNAMADELVAAYQQLEGERRRLAVTVASLGDALIVTEPGSAKIATVNPRAGELLPELAVGNDVDDDDSPLPPVDEALRGETVIEHNDRALAVTAARLGSESDGVVWTVRDISERARLERAKSEFVATASHELRSPLTSIKGFVELLERSSENMSERQREFVEIILKSTDRLVDLVNDLLDVARIEADHVEINRRPIDVGEAVKEVVELIGPRVAEKHQQLDVYVAPNLPLALADPARVRQIVANLVTNAHLYTQEGGRIHVGVEPDRAWVQIVVEDSGVGMTLEEASRVFDRFYRGRKGSTPGTGLGLSIVKSLVELHQGQVGRRERARPRQHVPGAAAGGGHRHRDRRVPRGDPRPQRAGRRRRARDRRADRRAARAARRARHDRPRRRGGDRASAPRQLRRGDARHPDAGDGRLSRSCSRSARTPELRNTPIVFVSVFSGQQELAGEWAVTKPIDADELRNVLGAAVRAGRSRVLVVGRPELQSLVEPALDDLGIEHQWELTGAAAARVCEERRFEVALVDVGVRNPQAVLQALDLRGRRVRRVVILFSDSETPTPPGVNRLGMEVVPAEEAAGAVLAALKGETGRVASRARWLFRATSG